MVVKQTLKFCFVFYILNLFVILEGRAQTKEIYPFLNDDPSRKSTYYKQAKESFNQLIESLKGDNAKEYKKIYTERFESISELINGTRSITNTATDQYLQKIVEKITTSNGSLGQKPLRVFFTRDWWPNACSMGDGTIAINAALLLYLNNEAELAFVICHELAHYYLDHSNIAISKYIETVNSKEFQGELKKISKEKYGTNQQLEILTKNLLFNNRRHSREKEAEADSKGFELFKKSGYAASAAKSCLQILNKIDDVLLYKPLVLEQVFNLPSFPFKTKWIKKENSLFSKTVQEDEISSKEKDSLKTHPDCNKRIVLLADSISRYNSSTIKFQIDSLEFEQLKKQFSIEIIEETYRQNDIGRHLYYSLLQLQENRDLPFACYSIAKSLLQIYKFQKDHTLGKYVDKESKYVSNDYNLLLRMLSNITLAEISNLNKAFVAYYNPQMIDFEKWQTLTQQINEIN